MISSRFMLAGRLNAVLVAGTLLTALSITGCQTSALTTTGAASAKGPQPLPPRFLNSGYPPDAYVRARIPVGTSIDQARLLLSDDGLSTNAQFSNGGKRVESLTASYVDRSNPGSPVAHVFHIGIADNQVAGITYVPQTVSPKVAQQQAGRFQK